jgi:hypothetical protein
MSYRVAVFGLCFAVERKQCLYYEHWSLIVMFNSEQASTLLDLELSLINKYRDWGRDFMTRVQILSGPEITIHICSGAQCECVQFILWGLPRE